MFCRCKSEACTLVELGLWPATPTKPVMAFTFGLMELVEKMFLVAKVSVQQCCASLPGFSNFPISIILMKWCNLTLARASENHNGQVCRSVFLVAQIPDPASCFARISWPTLSIFSFIE
jgi:hypothetical protein